MLPPEEITPPFFALLFLKVPPLIVTIEPVLYDFLTAIKPPSLFSKVPPSIVISILMPEKTLLLLSVMLLLVIFILLTESAPASPRIMPKAPPVQPVIVLFVILSALP